LERREGVEGVEGGTHKERAKERGRESERARAHTRKRERERERESKRKNVSIQGYIMHADSVLCFAVYCSVLQCVAVC